MIQFDQKMFQVGWNHQWVLNEDVVYWVVAFDQDKTLAKHGMSQPVCFGKKPLEWKFQVCLGEKPVGFRKDGWTIQIPVLGCLRKLGSKN